MKTCEICEVPKPLTEFYKRNSMKKGDGHFAYCKSCFSKKATVRSKYARRTIKVDAMAYMGGACIDCGYSEHVWNLEFHHVDPTEKEFSLAGIQSSFNDKVKRELDKCVLLCVICHRNEHARIRGAIAEPPKFTP